MLCWLLRFGQDLLVVKESTAIHSNFVNRENLRHRIQLDVIGITKTHLITLSVGVKLDASNCNAELSQHSN